MTPFWVNFIQAVKVAEHKSQIILRKPVVPYVVPVVPYVVPHHCQGLAHFVTLWLKPIGWTHPRWRHFLLAAFKVVCAKQRCAIC